MLESQAVISVAQSIPGRHSDESSAPARPPQRRTLACVVGTRPEIIKMAPVLFALREQESFTTTLINTGQHRELVDDTLATFNLVPDVNLDLMRPAQRLAGFLGRCIEALDTTVATLKPDALIAEGDTSTVLAAGLVAFYQDLPFFHVEAGLRTGKARDPFPEEMNRAMAARFAALHFAPTPAARDNLLHEGILKDRIELTGNPVIDALLMVRDMSIAHGVPRNPGKRLIVVTSHRRENLGEPLRSILRALKEIVQSRRDVDIVFLAHPNPDVQRAVAEELHGTEGVRVTSPLPYGQFVTLMNEADLIFTDSGGLQEEAPALGKPVLVLRQTTERPEAIQAGVARLVGTRTDAIVHAALELLDNPAHYRAMARGVSPYGDGHAASRIVERIARYFEITSSLRHPR
jgi:UDP-N-acetylglucosamine 2-epimerase (non-hydrolysing)